MQITAALLVEEVVKHPNGKVDLIGLYEDIYTEEAPVTVDNVCLFLDLQMTPDDRGRKHGMEVRLLDAEDQPVRAPFAISFDVPAEADYPRSTAQLDLDFPDVTLPRFGAYVLEIVVNGQPTRRVPLTLQPRVRLNLG